MHRVVYRCRHAVAQAVLLLVLIAAPGPAFGQQPITDPEIKQLTDAVRQGRADDLRALLAQGVPPHPEAVLMACFRRPRAEMLAILLAAGADPEARVASDPGVNEPTPLLMASINGDAEKVRMLLEAGASPSKPALFLRMEMTPLEAATRYGNSEVIGVLSAAGGERSAEATALGLMGAIGDNDAELVKTILDSGADPNISAGANIPPLHLAATKGDTTIARMLLDAGADVNLTGDNGWTALMSAAQSGSGAMARLLLEAGANVDARNGDGQHAVSFSGGVDEVTDPIVAASPELQGFRNAPKIEGPGTYAPGRYSAPCYHRGAPGAGEGCGDNGVESTAMTTVRSNIAHGGISPPECRPIELALPGEYTFTTFSSTNPWAFDSCHELRSTTGETRTLAYASEDPQLEPTRQFKVIIAGGSPAPSSDDRCNEPRVEIVFPEFDENFSFDTSDPGRLEIPLQASVQPEDCDVDVVWEARDIEGSERHILSADGSEQSGTGRSARLVYEGLPLSNQDMGALTITARVGDQVDDVDVLIFFDPMATNHPETHPVIARMGHDVADSEVPNWFYYYTQGVIGGFDAFVYAAGATYGYGEYIVEENRLEVGPGAYGEFPGVEIPITGIGACTPTRSSLTVETTYDIESVARIVAHELRHQQLMQQAGQGEIASRDNMYDRDNDGVHSDHEQTEPPFCLMDNDPNTHRLSAAKLMPQAPAAEQASAQALLDIQGDNELMAIEAENHPDFNRSQDWARCGLQWKKGGCQ